MDYWRQTLIKKDLEDLNNYSTWFKESHYPGEMYFIPNPESVEEDDGVLITLVFDGIREQSYVMLLDGKTFEEINISYLPHNSIRFMAMVFRHHIIEKLRQHNMIFHFV